MKHYQNLRKYGDANHKTQRKSLIPLHIPGGEIICDYQKAKLIMSIVSEIEKMVMCGYIDNESSFNSTLYDLIPEQRCSKQDFYTKYIEPILDNMPMLTIFYERGEKLTKLVDEIIKNGKTTDDSYLKHWNLTSVGIKREGSEYCFSCSDEDVLEKLSKLKIDNTHVYEICHKLKIHFRRYIKLQSRIERLV
ncbi:MAG: hypothetical protein KGI28_02360 [Thaumarchaeota archaeon]|nr:hypothetical protein [Nitrososphaerota archaeon]